MIFQKRKKQNEEINVSVKNEKEECETSSTAFSIGMKSILGNRRNQQDKALCKQLDNSVIAVLCDGMGGMEDGERASCIAAERFISDMKNEKTEAIDLARHLQEEMDIIDEEINGLTKEDGERLDCGTTLAAVIIKENQLWYVSVGDSRIYLLRNERLQCLTRDHNFGLVLEEYRDKGYLSEEEYKQEIRERKTQALISYLGLGRKKLIDCNENAIELCDKDKIIICSDGLYKALYDRQIQLIADEQRKNSDAIAERLVQAALRCSAGDLDNTTVVVIEYYEK